MRPGMRKPALCTAVHKIYLFILQYVSPLLFMILEICKLQVIPYEKLHKCCKFY